MTTRNEDTALYQWAFQDLSGNWFVHEYYLTEEDAERVRHKHYHISKRRLYKFPEEDCE